MPESFREADLLCTKEEESGKLPDILVCQRNPEIIDFNGSEADWEELLEEEEAPEDTSSISGDPKPHLKTIPA
ncbi:hypothetical protein NDU88_001429 [Pleurodeles waltl]|uniref:Uncharacterized protein n=1 Tax=Pleurodeles waltl TaxID=8319 RepID=A0AAV7SC91_PLEWA|nr:hypothetical protein NDU88_001429 [Pleurodeles waltl]